MKLALAALILLLAAFGGGARPESLVATLSDDAVEITSNFTGERIVVFGAIRNAPESERGYQVAVVVQGPEQRVTARRKERVLGVWANRAARSFEAVPSYYVMQLSKGFTEAIPATDFAAFRLGIASLPFVQETAGDAAARAFAQAVIDIKVARALFEEREGEVEFLAPNVFRTTFFLPSDIPTGQYRVSVYLFRGASFLAGATEMLTIVKGGFSARVARIASDEPLFYGLVSVALALFTGWIAGVIFRRP